MHLDLSMAGFALATSITPGPVNLVALASAGQHGLRPALRHVTGATLGFIVLLVASGAGLLAVMGTQQGVAQALRIGGVAYLLWLAWGLARDRGDIGEAKGGRPSYWRGALMQWLNPKAWLACAAGVAAFADGAQGIARFAAIYLVVCWLSLACWAWAGAVLQRRLGDARRWRLFNRLMAALLAASAGYLWWAR
ncbi:MULTISPECIES: LysE family translocator [unclassified Pseudomonas]|uniref:LysE family translocator n=1 Tax=unclassified Pseudomonas TaxID=196821 RepID=UPI000BD480C0|nr:MULTISPECIES: LysE family translocator [unclassified Pseudomonas]PVZ20192.1 threonine/homoserine/homoserine lactone efflux protein [Pseudomonas sp. URIL14HWK12:I12]PVZ27258.1 threonine/homoserine/homoserine lactone efflux protein [Pseudomonas sp. URIL14HWK12:I10]PVZ38147.1 threonine/homoserine/homoserine lactone efflux protein [Pseudomonas sp. URIL14HWK12:I11]SNZ04418.1 Threonine/homoserine/homoserine lactone efflux protein [Pseudomonas sp. URIL14HWK12:I9]